MERRSERDGSERKRLMRVNRWAHGANCEGGCRQRGAEEHYTEAGHVAHALVLASLYSTYIECTHSRLCVTSSEGG
jgi:hypothetical protein